MLLCAARGGGVVAQPHTPTAASTPGMRWFWAPDTLRLHLSVTATHTQSQRQCAQGHCTRLRAEKGRFQRCRAPQIQAHRSRWPISCGDRRHGQCRSRLGLCGCFSAVPCAQSVCFSQLGKTWGSLYFLFLQEQIKDIIIITNGSPDLRGGRTPFKDALRTGAAMRLPTTVGQSISLVCCCNLSCCRHNLCFWGCVHLCLAVSLP